MLSPALINGTGAYLWNALCLIGSPSQDLNLPGSRRANGLLKELIEKSF